MTKNLCIGRQVILLKVELWIVSILLSSFHLLMQTTTGASKHILTSFACPYKEIQGRQQNSGVSNSKLSSPHRNTEKQVGTGRINFVRTLENSQRSIANRQTLNHKQTKGNLAIIGKLCGCNWHVTKNNGGGCLRVCA